MKTVAEFPNLFIVDHPVILDRLTTLRRKETATEQFRQLLEEISHLMAYPVTQNMAVKQIEIETPMVKATMPALANDGVVIVPVLRAGLGMVAGLHKIFPKASIGHIGVYRDHETHEPIEYLVRLPENQDQTYLVVDPMLATGHSLAYAADILIRKGVKTENIIFMVLLASPEGVAYLQDKHPGIVIYTASLDSHLNEKAYIIPGLGDAGDRLFGTN